MSQRDESDAHEQPRQPQERDQEETWLDFLWSAGGTVASGRFSSRQQPSNEPQRPPTRRTDSQDRKRPLTAAPEPERRGHFPSHRSYTGRVMLPGQNFGASGNENGAGQTGDGTTVETTIDLATSPIASRIEGPMRRVADESRRDSEGSRRGSDQLPRWQPDEEVAKCPVCGNAFNFWTRRHHCRKCGRVVCSTCSPHRITIPRQYIVQPPDASSPAANMEISLSRPNLGGGEVVRVCNPCVPDPWTPDAPSSPAANGGRQDSVSIPPFLSNRRERSDSTIGRDAARYRYIGPHHAQRDHASSTTSASAYGIAGRNRSASHQPLSNRPLLPSEPRPAGLPPRPPQPTSSSYQPRSGMLPPPLPRHRHSQSGASSRPLSATPQPAPQSRRIIPEEDECPVCGEEMSPGESLREQHIQDCIATRFGSGTPSSQPRSQAPLASSRLPLNPAAATVAAASSTTQPPPTNRARASSSAVHRPRGMAVYRATEKDCLDSEGGQQECVICFEEFEPGDELGRMECLCKFHRACIRGWWERKGVGICPTHALNE